MGTDVMPPMSPATYGTGISISIDAEREDEASQIFQNLSAGVVITLPLEKMFWGTLFSMLTDQYGIQWMVNDDEQKK